MNVSIRELKNFNADITALEDSIALFFFGKGLRDVYESKGVEVPEWLTDSLRRIDRAIHEQTREAKELRAKEVKQQLEGLASREEKKLKLQQELEKLNAEGVGTPTTK